MCTYIDFLKYIFYFLFSDSLNYTSSKIMEYLIVEHLRVYACSGIFNWLLLYISKVKTFESMENVELAIE